jgi:Xaa-Pro aminopeptidase
MKHKTGPMNLGEVFSVRVEDTVGVRPEGPKILTDFVRKLEM